MFTVKYFTDEKDGAHYTPEILFKLSAEDIANKMKKSGVDVFGVVSGAEAKDDLRRRGLYRPGILCSGGGV